MNRVSRAIRAASWLMVAALALVAGCESASRGATDPGGGTVLVAASAGTTPIYSWTGPMAVTLSVSRAATPTTIVWGISSPVNRDLPSGTQHGVVPQGATETASTERTLTIGIRYRVTVALIDGTSGSADFTP